MAVVEEAFPDPESGLAVVAMCGRAVVLGDPDFSVILEYFFFQAEDGIRDRNVTGVQTCALPISLHRLRECFRGFCERIGGSDVDVELALPERRGQQAQLVAVRADDHRSEERRVGKGWRWQWWRKRSQILNRG